MTPQDVQREGLQGGGLHDLTDVASSFGMAQTGGGDLERRHMRCGRGTGQERSAERNSRQHQPGPGTVVRSPIYGFQPAEGICRIALRKEQLCFERIRGREQRRAVGFDGKLTRCLSVTQCFGCVALRLGHQGEAEQAVVIGARVDPLAQPLDLPPVAAGSLEIIALITNQAQKV